MIVLKAHPMIVHFPIALLLVASGAGFGLPFRRAAPELRVLTWWCMFLGWVATGAAILTGLFDQRGLAPDVPFRGSSTGTSAPGWHCWSSTAGSSTGTGSSAGTRHAAPAPRGMDGDDLLAYPPARLWLARPATPRRAVWSSPAAGTVAGWSMKWAVNVGG